MRQRLTYANVMSTIAVFVAVGLGGAYAADKITSRDLAKNSVKSKAIKDRGVKGKDVKPETLTGANYKDGSVAAADLAPNPPVQNLQLGNGGQGDCLWTDGVIDFPGGSPVSLRRDAFGEVSLSGAAAPLDGPGGDGACSGAGPDAQEDSLITTLPAADRPALSQVFANPSGGGILLVVGANGLSVGMSSFAPGSVLAAVSGPAFLNEVSFLAANAPNAPAPASGRERISPSVFRSLMR